MKKLYPIGTILTLKNSYKKLMITGRFVKSPEDEKVYHYAACFYPHGIISTKENILFDTENIEFVIHEGYTDLDEYVLVKEITKAIAE